MISGTLRITLIIVILCYFILILYFLKKKAISLKYTLLWIFSGICMSVFVVWPRLLFYIKRLIGMESNMNVLFVSLIGFILIILMALTSIVSGQAEKTKKLIQYIAVMEKRIRELEDQVSEYEENNSKQNGDEDIESITDSDNV